MQISCCSFQGSSLSKMIHHMNASQLALHLTPTLNLTIGERTRCLHITISGVVLGCRHHPKAWFRLWVPLILILAEYTLCDFALGWPYWEP